MTLILSCNQLIDEVDNTFIVPADSVLHPQEIDSQPPPPPPIKRYYFPSNFIIDTGGHIYFYQQKIETGWICGTGIEWDTPPTFIDLQPKDIIEVPSQHLDAFIKLNIQYLDNSDRQFAIGSVADTITSSGLATIFSIFKDKSNHINWVFRRTTQEEDVVLRFKKRKEKFYNSDEINWDLTKILLPPKFEDNIKFTTPKVVAE